MAQLFLSYAREDRECAERLAHALEKRGWSVWWDPHIPVGRPFTQVIEEELSQARCAIVLWSRHSVKSGFVLDEASRARDRNVLVPVRIEDVPLPVGFGQLQTADLFHWRNGFDTPAFAACVSSIEMLVRETMEMKVLHRPAPVSAAVGKAQADEFWISQDGKQFCAPDVATLRRWAEERRVQPDSYIYHASFGRWIAARDVQSLHGAFPKAAARGTTATAIRVAGPPPVAAPMAYQIRQDGQQLTAPDLDTLCAWAEEGRIDLGSRVYDPRRQQWVAAREIPEFFHAYRTPPSDGGRKSTYRPFFLALGMGLVLLVVALVAIAVLPDRKPKESETTVTTDTVAVALPVAVSIQNRCTNKTIRVAVCCLERPNGLATTGWFDVRPRQTRAYVATAIGPRLYFYGVSGKSTWYGASDDPLTRVLPIDSRDPFELRAEVQQGKTISMVPYFGRRLEPGETAYTQILTCSD